MPLQSEVLFLLRLGCRVFRVVLSVFLGRAVFGTLPPSPASNLALIFVCYFVLKRGLGEHFQYLSDERPDRRLRKHIDANMLEKNYVPARRCSSLI